MKNVLVTGRFDDFRARQVRLLHEASRLGNVHVVLWSDAEIEAATGRPPRFPQAERLYVLQSVRYVAAVGLTRGSVAPPELAAAAGTRTDLWVADAAEDDGAVRTYCAARGIDFRPLADEDLKGVPADAGPTDAAAGQGARVLVTGCYDWFHSGHVRFFEEASQFGDLYVVVGHDANIRLLKGEGHPLFRQDERRYMVQAVKFVKKAQISTGSGWLDAEPELRLIKPNIYVVNEDGDRPEKKDFCVRNAIAYRVLKRVPKDGLPRRQSTALRGF